MRQSEIKKKREDIESRQRALDKNYDIAQSALRAERRELISKCKHPNMSGGQYSRWCSDCGLSEDTT